MAGPPKGFADLHKFNEDQRIQLIGEWIMANKRVAAVAVDSDPPEKADRYVTKLNERFAGKIKILEVIRNKIITVIRVGPAD